MDSAAHGIEPDLLGLLAGPASGAMSGDDVAEHEQAAAKWLAQRFTEIDYDLAHPEAQQLADHLYSLGVGTLIKLNRGKSIFSRRRSLRAYLIWSWRVSCSKSGRRRG